MENINIKRIILIGVMLFSLSISSQVSRKQATKTTNAKQALTNSPTVITSLSFWSEDFGTSQKYGDRGNLADGCKTNNGLWSKTKIGPDGQKPNNWYISSASAGMGVGNCSEGWIKNNDLDNRTLHIGFDYRSNDNHDFEAIYARNESSATDCRIESPSIDCSGKSNITLNFDYFSGGIAGVDFFSVYYFDGGSWSLITTYGPSTNNPECDTIGRATWKSSDTYQLPTSADNNPEVKIGFRWKNEAGSGGNTELYSVSIDNITLSDNSTQIQNVDPTSSSSRIRTKKNLVEVTPVRNIEFTVYPNPNSGQFTIDFAGIENNHEVQIVLSDIETGKQIYTTTFFSNTIEHNKIDVNPSDKIKAGRYSCSLICEGIKITKQVIIN